MKFMFQHMLWILTRDGMAPIPRLAAVYLSSNGAIINSEYEVNSSEPTRKVNVKAVAAWVGCSETELLDALFEHIVHLGFQPLYVEDGDVFYSLPELPGTDDLRPISKPDPVISIYVFTQSANVSKIGISRDVIYRLAGLQSANPTSKLSIAYQATGPASKIRRAERRAHEMLSSEAIGNEWFRVGAAQAIEVVKAALDLVGLKG